MPISTVIVISWHLNMIIFMYTLYSSSWHQHIHKQRIIGHSPYKYIYCAQIVYIALKRKVFVYLERHIVVCGN